MKRFWQHWPQIAISGFYLILYTVCLVGFHPQPPIPRPAVRYMVYNSRPRQYDRTSAPRLYVWHQTTPDQAT